MFQSFNPYTSQVLKEYNLTSQENLNTFLVQAEVGFKAWKQVTLPERCRQVVRLGELLNEHKQEASLLITQEMGKPIVQSRGEIDKCVALCNFYAAKAEDYLRHKSIATDFTTYVRYDPLGTILGIMPWNFPFWQVFRFAIPTLLAGNAVIIKHAPNVPQCALFIESLFAKAFEISNVYQNIFLTNPDTQKLIQNPIIKGVSLTGSTRAGKAVAAEAGKNLKPVILELGGSNALIVCKDADLDNAVQACINGRFKNNGQSCIAVKRLLVEASVEKLFVEKLLKALTKLKTGNPLDENTFFSVLANSKFVDDLKQKLNKSIEQGAEVIYGGTSKGAYFEPTVVTNVSADMTLFKEETFGPVLPIISFETIENAIQLANNTDFGLGVSVFTKDENIAMLVISELNDGAVVINDFVKSMPELPFGGTKTSGLGRELSEEGIKAFTNTKTVVIK